MPALPVLSRLQKDSTFEHKHPRGLRGRWVTVTRGPDKGMVGKVVGTEAMALGGPRDRMLLVQDPDQPGVRYRFLPTDVKVSNRSGDVASRAPVPDMEQAIRGLVGQARRGLPT